MNVLAQEVQEVNELMKCRSIIIMFISNVQCTKRTIQRIFEAYQMNQPIYDYYCSHQIPSSLNRVR